MGRRFLAATEHTLPGLRRDVNHHPLVTSLSSQAHATWSGRPSSH